MSVRIGLALLAVLTALPALAAKPRIQWDTAYDFSTIKTFQWQEPPGDSLKQTDPFLHAHIVNAIEFQLSQSGLTEVAESPDVYVNYTSSTERDVRLESDTFGYGFGGYNNSWGRFGYGVGFGLGRRFPVGVATTTTRVVEVERGTLVVDIWDAARKELIWRGTAAGIHVSNSQARTQRNVEKAIESMAKQARKLQTRAQKR